MIHFTLFLWISFLVTFTPGPSVLFAISQSIRIGFIGALPGLIGSLTASICYGLLTACGIGFFLQDHPLFLKIISLIGSTYLILMGIKFMFAKSENKFNNLSDYNANCLTNSIYKDFIDGFVVNLSNPKIMLFYLIVIPQFIVKNENMVLSLIVLALIQNAMKAGSLIFYSVLAYRLRNYLGTIRSKVIQKISGSIIIAAGLVLLLDNML